MGVLWHLFERRFFETLACAMAMLSREDHKRPLGSTPPPRSCRSFVHRKAFGWRQGYIGSVLIGLTLGPLPVARSQAVDEGEFSPAMLGYKLQLVSGQFAQAEIMLLKGGAAGSTLKQLARVHHEIECLKAELRCGWYYPDLLDEQIVITREKLRLILAAPAVKITQARRGSGYLGHENAQICDRPTKLAQAVPELGRIDKTIQLLPAEAAFDGRGNKVGDYSTSRRK